MSFPVVLLGVTVSILALGEPSVKRAPIMQSAVSPTPQSSTFRRSATVRRVIDGDTIELKSGLRVRYIGVDTPETVDPRRRPVQCYGKDASLRNRELVEGKIVELESDKSKRDKYGRLLYYAYIDGVMVNEQLVRDGFARAKSYPPDIKYQDRLRAAEKEARAAGRGLWSHCPATQAGP
ncbi:MAG: thermonuclease family protein [Patescibacteria group bacterium]